MVTHIVAWKYRADVPQEARNKHLAMLQALHHVVAGIEGFAVGSDFLRAHNSYDTGLFARFRDRSVLEAYTVHPEHVKVVEYGRTIAATMSKVDFEE
jgi:Stress responsive A/B Barrel Domain